MFSAKHHTELPSHFRNGGLYPYLTTGLREYWYEAINVAHGLLAAHSRTKGSATYYQDNFGDDFRCALTNDWIERPVIVTSEHHLSNQFGALDRKKDPAWCQYRVSVAELVTLPRGTQLLVHMANNRGAHWEVRIHAGAGHVFDCNTIPRFRDKPAGDDAVNALLDFEAYLARQQAQRELAILQNYAQVRDLGLHPGMRLVAVPLLHNGTTRPMSFDIGVILETGVLQLTNGRLRGSKYTFATTMAATGITASNIDR